MSHGKNRVEHFSLFPVFIPFNFFMEYQISCNGMVRKSLPRLLNNPGPNAQRLPLNMKCEAVNLLYEKGHLPTP